MLLLDVNVLPAAHRADHPDHGVAAAELGAAARGDEPFTVPALGWASLLRLATNRRVFGVPSSLDDVFAFIDAVLAALAVELGATVVSFDHDFDRFSVRHRRPGG